MREEGELYPHVGVLLPSEPVSYNTAVRSFLKLMIIIEHIKVMQIPYLDVWSVLLSLRSN